MPLSEILLSNVQKNLKVKEVSEMQTTIALFKMQEGLLESTPQSLLQGSIQFRDDKFFTIKEGDLQAGILDMVTVLISLFSMAAAWTTLYLKMPYTTRSGRGEVMEKLMRKNRPSKLQRI